MPKNITATTLMVESLNVEADESGNVTGLAANVNVAYGEARVREQYDLWAGLTAEERAAFQLVYDALGQQLQATYFA